MTLFNRLPDCQRKSLQTMTLFNRLPDESQFGLWNNVYEVTYLQGAIKPLNLTNH